MPGFTTRPILSIALTALVLLAGCSGETAAPVPSNTQPTAVAATPAVVEAGMLPLPASGLSVSGGQSPAQPTPTALPSPTAQPTPEVIALTQPYGPISMDVLVRINDWRVSLGLWPFKVNPLLTKLAQAQADYLAGLSHFPDDPHADASGKHPKQRAAEAGWPAYNTADQMAVDEVAYTGASPASAMTWWRNSAIHARTLSQTAYREIGVADADMGHGRVYVGVVASRPNEIPALLDPSNGTWYLSSEQYRWAKGDRLQEVTRFSFLTDPAEQVTQPMWQVYALTAAAANLGDMRAVALSDGSRTVVVPLSLPDDIAWLSTDKAMTSLTIPPSTTLASAPGAPGASPAATGTAEVASAPGQEPAAAEQPAVPSNTNLTLIYGSVSMTLWHNPPGNRLDISGVVLKAADGDQIATLDFEGPWLGVPLKSFSVGSCLQTWVMAAGQGDPGVVPGCYVRASVINLKARGKFWLKGPFDVLNNGALLRQCPVGPATCGVVVP